MAALTQVPMERFSDYRRVATPVFLHVYDVLLSGFPAQKSRISLTSRTAFDPVSQGHTGTSHSEAQQSVGP